MTYSNLKNNSYLCQSDGLPMISGFDKIISRCGTEAIKVDCLKERFGRDDLIPMWVADMDFESPDCIRNALENRLSHQIYGYSIAPDSYWESIINWESAINDWHFSKDDVRFIPGIVRGIAFVIQCFTNPGDNILVQPPVYMPFFNVPIDNGRKVVYNPLIYKNGSYVMDFENLEQVCRQERPKLMIISNPHNPAGIVWSKESLCRVAEICHKYGVLVISDEIHADLPLFGFRHQTFSNACADARQISITFAAPSKTFNIAGIVSSFCVIHNEAIKKRFYDYLSANEYDMPMFLSVVATEAAYTYGNSWRLEMLEYVQENVLFVEKYISENIKGIKVIRPQASFLVWLDCTGLGLTYEGLLDLFINKAHLALNDGNSFGPGGMGFMRMNVGTSKAVVERALMQLADAINDVQ